MGGSFWMFGATMTETNGNKLLFFLGIDTNFFFSRDSEAALDTQNGNKLLFFLGIQRRR